MLQNELHVNNRLFINCILYYNNSDVDVTSIVSIIIIINLNSKVKFRTI